MEVIATINENAPIPRGRIQEIEEEAVGFENDVERIIKLLTSGIKELDIIPIFGMPGLGKTTLAKKIFKDRSTISHFDVRVWRTISQSYDVREMWRDIYSQVTELHVHPDDDIADMLRKCLIGKRYLIVLDDIWEVKVWEELQLSFPKEWNGSRIILTTRLEQVAREVKHYTDPYSLQFLTLEASWKLLQEKVFQKEACPPELLDVGIKLAEYSKGLPLAIVLIGGIIANRQRNASEWCEVENSFNSEDIGVVENEGDLAIQLSYRYLPDHLRPCLLTFGAFREDEKIEASRLMSLWMAEGFVQCSDDRGLEEIVKGYLTDLIASSLVMVLKKSSDGNVKKLQIHDLVRDFVLSKVKEEKFMQVIGSHNQYQLSYNREHRVCIHSGDELHRHLQTNFDASVDAFLTCISKEGTSFEQNLGSFFVTNDNIVRTLSLSSFGNFTLLRVFDLANYILVDYQNILQSLVQLRYIRMTCDEFYFEWVSHLCHLETLLVNSKKVVTTPHIWKMLKLRHVNVTNTFLPREIVLESESPAKLENLRTFEIMILDGHDVEYLVERFPSLQKLWLAVGSRLVLDSLCLNLEVLTQLQSLELFFLGTMTKFYFPSGLKKLILHNACISECAASSMVELPNLESLYFVDCEFQDNEWDVRDVEFSVLKSLKFRGVDLKQWHVSESSFPVLEKLVLIRCRHIEEIPHDFVDVETLKLVKVISCQKSLRDSALEIKEEVEAITGSDNLEVYISPPYFRGTANDFSDEGISKCKEIFSFLDKDGDGLISTQVLMETLMKYLGPYLTEAELRRIIKDADGDGDESLSFPEFLNVMARRSRKDLLFREELFKKLFRQFDEDKDGFISADVLSRIIIHHGEHTLEEADEMLRKADVNGDGRISYKEFVKVAMPKRRMSDHDEIALNRSLDAFSAGLMTHRRRTADQERDVKRLVYELLEGLTIDDNEPEEPICCCAPNCCGPLLCCLVTLLCCIMGHCH